MTTWRIAAYMTRTRQGPLLTRELLPGEPAFCLTLTLVVLYRFMVNGKRYALRCGRKLVLRVVILCVLTCSPTPKRWRPDENSVRRRSVLEVMERALCDHHISLAGPSARIRDCHMHIVPSRFIRLEA